MYKSSSLAVLCTLLASSLPVQDYLVVLDILVLKHATDGGMLVLIYIASTAGLQKK